jgi:hypothetical protein
MAKTLKNDDVNPGDVLLCFSRTAAERAKAATGSSYYHAAICMAPLLVAEVTIRGVRKTPLASLIDQYDHVAVLRFPVFTWDSTSIAELNAFVDSAINKGLRLSMDKVRELEDGMKETKQDEHRSHELALIRDYFDTKSAPTDEQDVLCSEFISKAFIETKTLSAAAGISLAPPLLSPGDLGRDFTYGAFVGYLVPADGLHIPETDEFYSVPTFHERWPGQ